MTNEKIYGTINHKTDREGKQKMTDMIVANTILEQLGGRRFIAMTGAKNFVGEENALSFMIGRNYRQINHVRIYLNALDLYEMTFSQVRKNRFNEVVYKQIENFTDVYFDQLQDLFTKATGMYTRLF